MDSDDDIDYDTLFDTALNTDAVKNAMAESSIITPLKIIAPGPTNEETTPTNKLDDRDPKRRRLSSTPSMGDLIEENITTANTTNSPNTSNTMTTITEESNPAGNDRRKTTTTRELIPESAYSTVDNVKVEIEEEQPKSESEEAEATESVQKMDVDSDNQTMVEPDNQTVATYPETTNPTSNETTSKETDMINKPIKEDDTTSRNVSDVSTTSVETLDLNNDPVPDLAEESPKTSEESTTVVAVAEEKLKTEKENPASTTTTTETKAVVSAAPKRVLPKCSTCNKEDGTIITPMGAKRRNFLCVGCAKKCLFCTSCNAPAKKKSISDIERCKVCGWLNCPKGECFGECSTCSGALRPLKWKQCSLKACKQSWAETNKWCSTCGSCALKTCTAKFSSCKLLTCRTGTLPNPCARAASTGSAPAKHYHCSKCKEKAKKSASCSCCEKMCSCKSCNSCSTGDCCNAKTQRCSLKGCVNDVCRRCASKNKSTGKYSSLCTEHFGARNTLTTRKASHESTSPVDTGATQPVSQIPSKTKKRRCSKCDGTEREHNKFKNINGDFYCPPCSR